MTQSLRLLFLAGLFCLPLLGGGGSGAGSSGASGGGAASPGPTAPELSTGAVYTGAIILIGGVLMLADWLRKRKNSVA